MGENICSSHGNRRREGYAVFHGKIGNTAFSRKNCIISHKSNQFFLFQNLPKYFLIDIEEESLFHFLLVNILVEECMFNTIRKKIKEDLFQLSGTDGAAKGRESNMKPDKDPVIRDLTGTSFQNFLSASADRDQTTLT